MAIMPIGECRLCQKTRELRDSHLMPKALYKITRKAAEAENQPNSNPVVITPSIAVQTSKQVSDYLLCDRCEDILSKGGEAWMMANCWRSNSTFAIRDALENSAPVHTEKDGVWIYEGSGVAGVDLPQLVHFGAGVFWRAACHQWSPINGHVPKKLDLGPYEEPLRLFVKGEGGFPSNMTMFVTVSSETEDGANKFALFPYLSNNKSGCRQYRFSIPGVVFQLFVGKEISDVIRFGCTATSIPHFVYYGSFDAVLADMETLRRRAKPKGDLVQL